MGCGASVKEDKDLSLVQSATVGNSSRVRQLLGARADPRSEDSLGNTALTGASGNGHVDCVKLVIDARAALNDQTSDGCTALILAAYRGHADCVKLLLDANARCDVRDKHGRTALKLADKSGESSQLLRSAEDGKALLQAAEVGNESRVANLLAAGTDPNYQESGSTPLICASVYGEVRCVCLLIDARANLDAFGEYGRTALSRASASGHIECVRLLIDANSALDAQDNQGWTALMIAAKLGHSEIVKLLVDASAAVDIQEEADTGSTALTLASHMGHSECVELLSNAHAKVDVKGTSVVTDLETVHRGPSKRHIDCARLLKAGEATTPNPWDGVVVVSAV